MNFRPVNRMILIDVKSTDEEESSTVLLPEGFKPAEKYGFGKVQLIARDCKIDLSEGDEIIFENSMLQTVCVADEEVNLLLENYVLAVTNGEGE